MNAVTQTAMRYGYLIVILGLYAFAISKSKYTRGIIGKGKRIQFGGESAKQQIGIALLIGLSILALALSFNSLTFTSVLFIFAVMLIGFVITGEMIVSIAIAIILGSVIVSYSTTGDYTYSEVEGFQEEKKEESKESKPEEKKEGKPEEKKEATPVKPAEKKPETPDDDIPDVDETFQFDQKSSVLDLYNSLSEEQVKGMKQDTKELMETQKQLIKTLGEMGPTLKQSKEILASFQNYFGDEKDMEKKLTDLKTAKL